MKSCGTCGAADHEIGYEHAAHGRVIWCTRGASFHCGDPMPVSSVCDQWTEPDEEPSADALERASREPGGESDSERQTRVLTERGGRVGGTW